MSDMKRLIVLVVTLLVLSYITTPAYAAKARVRAPRVVAPRGVSYSSAKLSRATHSVVLSLMNLSNVRSVEYELSYTAAGIPQGAMGSITVTGQPSDARDLYFGTCSKGVCTPHGNITNATLTVTTELKNGSSNVKRYKLKI